jgi:hypothetical protein
VRLGDRRLARACQRASDGGTHLRDVERLADVVERSGANRFHRRIKRAEAADQQHFAARIGMLERLQHVESRLGRVEIDVGDDEIEPLAARGFDRDVGGMRLFDVAVGAAISSAISRTSRFVVDDQDAMVARLPAHAAVETGRSIVNVVPRPGVLCTAIVPPARVITSRAMLRPSPVPRSAGFVVTHGSKTRGRRSGAMPTPVSVTSIRIPSPLREGGQRDHAAAGHRVNGVGQQIEQRKLEVGFIGHDRRKIRRDVCHDGHCRGGEAPACRVGNTYAAWS